MFTKRKFLTVLFGLFFIGFSLGSAPTPAVAAKAKYHSKVGCKKGTFHVPRSTIRARAASAGRAQGATAARHQR